MSSEIPAKPVGIQRDRSAIQSDLILKLQEATKCTLSADAAENLLRASKAWNTRGARILNAYLEENPRAFTAPSPHCPASLARLLGFLSAAGHGDSVALLACCRCGRNDRDLTRRTSEGLCCQRCAHRTQSESCSSCGRVREVVARNDGEPLCSGCYRAPPRLCGICGEVRTIHARANSDRPDTCTSCYTNMGKCVLCGQLRHGSRVQGGSFHCTSCAPRKRLTCTECGRLRIVAVTWPIGPVCHPCRRRRINNPQNCVQCQCLRVLIGEAESGGVCGPCSGSTIDYRCRRCGFPGNIHSDASCAHCVLQERIDLLFADADGVVPRRIQPVAEILASGNPWSVIPWLSRSRAAMILTELMRSGQPVTHELLDGFPQDVNLSYVRELFVSAGSLPSRTEHLAQLQLWIDQTIVALPPHQASTIKPFAEWDVLRDARQRSLRSRYTHAAATADRDVIRTAIMFITWLDTQSIPVNALTQGHVDLWLEIHPTRRNQIGALLRWLITRSISADFEIPKRHRTRPPRFLSEDELREQLRRCLNDKDLPLEVRVMGALTRLYALPLTRILELTTQQFHRDGDRGFLTLSVNPILLPPKLADMIEELIRSPGVSTFAATREDWGYLFPGRPPSRPRNVVGAGTMLKRHGLPTIHARNTAMIEAVTDLPAIIVSDLFGIHPATADKWVRLTQNSWADYLAGKSS